MYQQVGGNLLPFNPTDGGMACLTRWLNIDGSAAANNADQTLTMSEDTGVTSQVFPAGVAVPLIQVIGGAQYTAAVSCNHLVATTIRWIDDSGVVSAAQVGYGIKRSAVTAVAPQSARGAIIGFFAPTAHSGAVVTDTEVGTYWDITASSGGHSFIVDRNPPGPVTLVDAVFVQSSIDPGPETPTVIDSTFGQFVWNSLPGMFKDADLSTGLPLSKFLHGLFADVDKITAIRDLINAGGLTNPAVIPDMWVGWVGQLVGLPPASVAQTRNLLQSLTTAPARGSRASLTALGQTFLTGTKRCEVYPSTVNRWTINIRLRSDELSLVTDGNGFVAALKATGQVPAGFIINPVIATATWQSVDNLATGGSWAGIDAQRYWSGIDAAGVIGSA